MNFILYIISFILVVALSPLLTIYACTRVNGNEYFKNIAILMDELGGYLAAPIFNDILIKKDGVKFGMTWVTISHTLGENKKNNTLKSCGKFLCWILDKIQKNHIENSIL
jgi:hypothetical protein